MTLRYKLLILFLLLNASLGFAQFQKSHFMINGNTLPYQVLYPKDFDESKQYPLLVFLHGAGERGDNNESQLVNGRDFLLSNLQGDFSAIVIAPQCPDNTYWSNVQSNVINEKRTFKFGLSDKPTVAMETLIYLINDWLSSGLVDTKRVYVGGLSMGGMGTFELLTRMPNTFAAAFPICGGGSLDKASLYANNTALWIFHGETDSVVPVGLSQKMYQTLKELNCDVKYTEYPEVNHNSWDNVFMEKNLFSWLFSHKK